MPSSFRLLVLTPYGRYFDGGVTFLNVRSEKYNLGIYANHTPLISTVDICKVIIRTENSEYKYAVGGGVINIDKEKVTLILNSIERADEIDVNRAKEAKKRAEERLNGSASDEVDVSRAKSALLRAINRLDVSENN